MKFLPRHVRVFLRDVFRNKTARLLVVLFLVMTLPLTITVLNQQQNINPQAAGTTCTFSATKTAAGSIKSTINVSNPGIYDRIEWDADRHDTASSDYETRLKLYSNLDAATETQTFTGLQQATTKTYKMFAQIYSTQGGSMLCSGENWIEVPGSGGGSTTAPSAPTNVNANTTNTCSVGVKITWTASTGTVSGYYIYRGSSSTFTPSGTNTIGNVGSGTTSYTDTTATAGTQYYYKVGAWNDSGFTPSSADAGSCTSGSTGGTTYRLNGYVWKDTDGDQQIETSQYGGTEGVFANVTVAITQSGSTVASDVTNASGYFEVSGLDAGTYSVSAAEPSGWDSTTGEPKSVTLGPNKAVNLGFKQSSTGGGSAPGAFSASASTSTACGRKISVTWGASSNATSYTLHRSTSSGFTVSSTNQIGSTFTSNRSSSNPYIDTAPAAGTYYYKVKAINASGSTISSYGGATASAACSTGGTAPSAPTNVRAYKNSATCGINNGVYWDASSGTVSGYYIYRATTAIFTPNDTNDIGSVGSGVLGFNDPGGSANTTYYYKVCAWNSSGVACSANAGSLNCSTSGTTYTITGIVYSDTDGNLSYTSGTDTPIPNIVVTAESVAIGQAVGSGTTNQSGSYTITINTAGTYRLHLTPPSGKKATAPANVPTVAVSSTSPTATQNFGLGDITSGDPTCRTTPGQQGAICNPSCNNECAAGLYCGFDAVGIVSSCMPDNSNTTTVSLNLSAAGVSAVASGTQEPVSVQVTTTNGNTAKEATGTVYYNPTTQTYQGTVSLGNLSTGDYFVTAKLANSLSTQVNTQPVTITSQSITALPTADVQLGDSNNDNKLDIFDLNILLDCWGDLNNCTGSLKDSADFNGNGAVDLFDYNIFYTNASQRRN
jgi:hypothetical protein